jgi:hypothetical protein
VNVQRQESSLSIQLNKEDVYSHFLASANDWLKNQSVEVPKPFGIFDKVFREIARSVNAFKFSQSEPFSELDAHKGPGLRFGITCLLEHPYSAPVLGYTFSTRNENKFDLVFQGNILEKFKINISEQKFEYWSGVIEPYLEYKFQKLKTQENHNFRVCNFGVDAPPQFVADQLLALRNSCPCQIQKFATVAYSYSPLIRYFCTFCGKTYICSCFKDIEGFLKKNFASVYDGDKDGTKAKVSPYVLNEWQYRDGLCHLCRGISPTETFTHPMYCSTFMSHHSPWIYAATIRRVGHEISDPKSEENRISENELRERLGIPRIGEGWINETMLVRSLQNYFRGRFEVQHHVRPKYLEGQEYDIYIPQLRLAIEYDGLQHFEPVAHFGGEEGLQRTVARDRKKEAKAKAAGDSIIRVRLGYEFDRLVKEIEKLESSPIQIPALAS